jgi:hypothetical protein
MRTGSSLTAESRQNRAVNAVNVDSWFSPDRRPIAPPANAGPPPGRLTPPPAPVPRRRRPYSVLRLVPARAVEDSLASRPPHRRRARLGDVRRVGAAHPPRTPWTRRTTCPCSASWVCPHPPWRGRHKARRAWLSPPRPHSVVWPPLVCPRRHRSVCTA